MKYMVLDPDPGAEERDAISNNPHLRILPEE